MSAFPLCELLCVLSLAIGYDEPGDAPPLVPATHPVLQQVTDYEDFTGRSEASAAVELRARVTGYLEKIDFKEGDEVKKGDLLFEIDARPYRAELDRAETNLAVADAHARRADADFKRAEALVGSRAIGREEYDKIASDRVEAQAALRLARATLAMARINLDFTRVSSPLAGRIGRRGLDVGNLVKADDTILAVVIARDPVYVFFDLDERTALRLRRAEREGTLKGKEGAGLSVAVGLVDEDGLPHKGVIDFTDLRLDPKTSTLSVRAVLPNPGGLILPGMSVRVRLPTSAPHSALLVPEAAVGKENGKAFVFVVNDKDTLEQRLVSLGVAVGGLRVVKEGLKGEDWVAMGEPKKLREGMTVRPDKKTPPAP
jgi:RND family efflux transporter MFP subunit